MTEHDTFSRVVLLTDGQVAEITRMLEPKGYTLILDDRKEGWGVMWIRKRGAENFCLDIRGYDTDYQRYAVSWSREYMDIPNHICVQNEPHPNYVLEGTDYMAWSVYQLMDAIVKLPPPPPYKTQKS